MKHLTVIFALWSLSFGSSAFAQLVNSEWNTGGGNWNVATNWFPNDVPDNGGGITYDVEIGNRPVAVGAGVTFVPEDGTSDTMNNLTISGAADLFTNGNQVFVISQTTVDGVGSTIRIDPHATPGSFSLDTNNLDLNNGGAISMQGGILNVDILMEINAGSVLSGHGLVNLGDGDAVVEEVFENSEVIQLAGSTATPGTLTIQSNGVDTIDLDGDSEVGVVDASNVNVDLEADSLTLIVDGPLSDAFSGTLQVGQRDTITFNDDFTMSGADVQFDGGSFVATMNGPADVTSIASSAFTVTGDAVITNNMTFIGAGNTVTLNANSSLSLSGLVSMAPSSLNLASSSAELIVTGNFTAAAVGEDFNWDGPGTATTTISGSGTMSLSVDHVDTGNDIYGGTLNLNDNGDVSVNNTANEWTAAGTINKNNAGTSTISGERVIVTGNISVNAGTLDMPAVTTSSTAIVDVTGTLTFGGASELAGGDLDGSGLLRMEGTSTVTADTVISVNTFDWDGLGSGTSHTINSGVSFAITTNTFDTDGDMDDPINLAGGGSQLLMNGFSQWTMNQPINANNAGAGTALISGASRLVLSGASAVLNVNGDTQIGGPITYGAGSTTSIDAGFTLDVISAGTPIHAGGTITGAGTYSPGSTNTVTADSTISVTNFDFDGGSWTIESGAQLTVNVSDYDTATNFFDNTITLNSGRISVNSADAEFVMDGTLNMNNTTGTLAIWGFGSEPLDVGDDSGMLNADLNVGGSGTSQISAQTDFNSDADVNIAAGARLSFLTAATVNFDTVNGANNAEFTGAGTIEFIGEVNVNEAVTLNMVGGTVDLDGADSIGESINIDAPLTINAATMSNFGNVNGGGGINTLDVNNSVGTGVLTVTLDDPAAEWTLNGPGAMNLVNDNIAATLLAGSDVNIDGTLNVTGDVRTTARLDIAGVVNINTAGQPLRLAAGGNFTDPNTISGATITGAGILGADTGKALFGHGTINTDIDFDGTANLRADNGTLTINGAIIDVNLIGTDDADGVLNIPAAWNNNVAAAISMLGGTLQGGTITNDTANGIQGFGTVTSRVINNTRLFGGNGGGTLIFQTAGNDNDWDGAAGTGELIANGVAVLELRDNATFGFTGTVEAVPGGRVFTNGFALDFNPGSSINLTNGTYESTNSTNIGGTVTVNAGGDSTIEVEFNRFLIFEPTSTTTLNGNLQLVNNNIIIETGATFSGAGALIVPDDSHALMDPNANANVLVINDGTLRPNGFNTVGRVDVKDYQQGVTGTLVAELTGTALNQYDRVVVNGAAVLDGNVEVRLNGGFVPVLGNEFNILSASGGLTGAVAIDQPNNLPPGLFFNARFEPTILQLVVTDSLPGDYNRDNIVDAADYLVWRKLFGAVVADFTSADGNGDGIINDDDYGVWERHFGTVPPPGSGAGASVPEPSAMLWILGLSAAALSRRSRCKH